MATLSDRLTLAAFNAATQPQAGDVRVVWGEYTGTGQAGSSYPNSLSFSGRPLWVYIRKSSSDTTTNELTAWYGCNTTQAQTSNQTRQIYAGWTSSSIRWYALGSSPDPATQLNASGVKYWYVALVGM